MNSPVYSDTSPKGVPGGVGDASAGAETGQAKAEGRGASLLVGRQSEACSHMHISKILNPLCAGIS